MFCVLSLSGLFFSLQLYPNLNSLLFDLHWRLFTVYHHYPGKLADEKPYKRSWSLLDTTSNERNEERKIILLSDFFNLAKYNNFF